MRAPDPRSVPIGGGPGEPSGPAAVERVANYSAAIYGSILVAALVSTLDEEQADASAMAIAVLSTMVVFWLAHVWSDLVAERVETGQPFSMARFRVVARRQWPMVEAATAPIAVLVLAWTEVLALDVAVWLALGVSVAQLVGWGMVVGFRSSSTWPFAIVSGLVNGAFGLVIVALKAFVH